MRFVSKLALEVYGLMILICAALAIVGAQGASAASLELLGQPCRAVNILAGRVVTDRATGRELLVISNMNEDTGAELIFIDFENNTARVYSAPAGKGFYALNEVPDDRLIIGTFYDCTFMVFDLKRWSS